MRKCLCQLLISTINVLNEGHKDMGNLTETYYGVFDESSGEVFGSGLQIEKSINFSKKNRFLGNKRMAKINLNQLTLCPMTAKELQFFLKLIQLASYENIVRGPEGKQVTTSNIELACTFQINYKTISRYFKTYKTCNLLVEYDKKYFINPFYAIKFSLTKPPEIIINVYPKQFTTAEYIEFHN